MDLTVLETALAHLRDGVGFAWLTIVDSVGSSPRHGGTSMLVRSDGSSLGTIGGGALEAAAIAAAVEVVDARASRLMDYTLTNDDSARLGMICGGQGVVLIDYVDPGDPGKRDYLNGLRDLLAADSKGWTVSTVPVDSQSGWTSRSCVVDANGSLRGQPMCPLDQLQKALQPSGAQARDLAGPGTLTFIQPVGQQGVAYVFGAGHCGERLVPLLNSVGFHTVIVDDRKEFANAERFPLADRVVVPGSFDDVIEDLPIDGDSYVIIITRGHVHDRSVLQQALRTDAGYVGMIGSRKKVATIMESLRDEGLSEDDLARVFAPIGLDISAETPAEIAVSIAAQLIQIRASRRS